jgi:hypothetical protein
MNSGDQISSRLSTEGENALGTEFTENCRKSDIRVTTNEPERSEPAPAEGIFVRSSEMVSHLDPNEYHESLEITKSDRRAT